ncbi:MAG TPA: PAS domain S-box protein [Gaiellaceae bacterium]|nr:PAS domain S-box protein [Gaiellaceae bacterium]
MSDPALFTPDDVFDRLARLASAGVGSSGALVSRLDCDRHELLFTGSSGVLEIPRGERSELSETICKHVVSSGGCVAIESTSEDPLVRDEPVVAELGIGAYLGVPLITPDGEVVGVLCALERHPRAWSEDDRETLVGVAASVMTELELRLTVRDSNHASNERDAIVEAALDCIVTMDASGIVRDFNAAAERTFGYPRGEAIGRRLGDLIVPPEFRERHEQGLRRYLETGETKTIGKRLTMIAMRADGSTFPVELTIARVERAVPLFVGFVRDLSESLAAEDELEAAEARYRSLIENIPLVTYMNSAEAPFQPLFMSPQIESLLGYTSEEWLANPDLVRTGIHPDDRERIDALACDARQQGIPTRSEFRFVARDGRLVWVLDRTIPLRDAAGEIVGLQGFLLDITEQKALEEQLRQSQKMDAIGQLAGGIAHDFNNMLTAITGYAELLGYSFEEDDPRLEDIGELKRAAAHAAGLTRQLLAFSRKQLLLPRRLDPNKIVSDLEPILRRTIGEQIAVSIELASELSPVEADPDQLAQVVLNIAINARDAMPEGGRLTISTGNVELESDAYVAISIADTGAGMDEATREHIFEPFFTTKETGKGTGLGLATVYGVVSQSGGRIEVESAPGVGSTFRVLLPRAPAPSELVAA